MRPAILVLGGLGALVGLTYSGYRAFEKTVNDCPQDLRRADDAKDAQAPNIGGTRGLFF